MKCSECNQLIKKGKFSNYCKYHRAFIDQEILNKDLPCPYWEEQEEYSVPCVCS